MKNLIADFVILLSIEVLMTFVFLMCLFQFRITILLVKCSTKHVNAESRFPWMSWEQNYYLTGIISIKIVYIHILDAYFSFWKYWLWIRVNYCLRLDLKQIEGLPRKNHRCFRVNRELLDWLSAAFKHKSNGPPWFRIYEPVMKCMLSKLTC